MIRKTPARGAFDYLLSSNRITKAELNEALREASKDSKDIETILIEKYKVKTRIWAPPSASFTIVPTFRIAIGL